MSKMSERQRLGVTIGASVVLAGGVTALVFLDRKEIEDTDANIARLDQKIESAEVEIRKTKEREDKVIVYREVAPRELEILPQKQQIADFHAGLAAALAQTGMRLSKLPENSAKDSELALGVYVTPTTLECEGDAASFLRFVNMVENDPRLSTITGFKVKGGARPREGDHFPGHKISLHLETYSYSPKAKGLKPVAIANYDARLEDPKIRQEIASFSPEKQDTYFLRPSASRRDVFVDVRREVIVEDPEHVHQRYVEEERVVVDLEHRLDEVREKVEIEKALIARGDLFGADRVAQEVDTFLNELRVRSLNIASVKSVTFPDLLARVEKAKKSIDDVVAARTKFPRELTVTQSVARMTRDIVSAAFQRGDFAEVNSICSQWEVFLRGKAIEPAAQEVIDDVKKYRKRSKTLAEFHQIGMHVTSVIMNPVQPSQSVALLNGSVIRVGDALPPDGQIQVQSITREGVTFAFQGETVFVKRRDASASPLKDGRGRSSTGASVPVSAGAGEGESVPAAPTPSSPRRTSLRPK